MAFRSDLYKAFFDNATLSDLTILLSDRSVRVHRIVLCRRSEYFTTLLTGSFQESGSKEIELKEDDPESLVAVLRYMYDLAYDEEFDAQSMLLSYANVYITADKYQVHGLKLEASKEMKHILDAKRSFHRDTSQTVMDDFFGALRTIVTGTTASDVQARKVMVEACVTHLRYLHMRPEFLSVLNETVELSVAIIGHRDLEYGLGGAWTSDDDCVHEVSLKCHPCGNDFEGDHELEQLSRRADLWICPHCNATHKAFCKYCNKPIDWIYLN